MKFFVVFAIITIYGAAVLTAVALAVPLKDEIASEEQKVISRTRRDLAGVFDSISNGLNGLIEGAKTISVSIQNAFNGIFSTSNKNSLADGFKTFQKGVKDAANELHNTVSTGIKKIGDTVKGAFNNKDNQGSGQSSEKQAVPEGEVPAEQTT